MAYIPKIITKRLKGLKEQINLAIIFNDTDRISYLNNQLNMINDQIKNREEANEW